ncbi:MAG: voltage-gated potassium channel [Flavobacteriaceae bacterium]
MGFAISIIAENIFSKNNIGNLRQKRVEKKIKKTNNHIIIFGYGRNGQQAVHKLIAYKQQFVVIEKDEEVVNKYRSEIIPFILRNAKEDLILIGRPFQIESLKQLYNV